MKIVSLEPALEQIFWEHVKQDIPHYYFFAFDWRYNRDKTEILLALEGNRIEGMMLVFRQSIVQLRGSRDAVKVLCERLYLEKIELQALDEHKQFILRKYKPTWSHEMMLMKLKKGEERYHVKNPIARLHTSDAEKAAIIMREAEPEYWGDRTGQQIVERINEGVSWLGIKVKGELVSVGSARLTE